MIARPPLIGLLILGCVVQAPSALAGSPSFTPLGFASFARAVSADGSVVVGETFSGSNRQAFRWTRSGGMVGLGFLPGHNDSHATSLSADGTVIVGTSAGGNAEQAFRWTSVGMVGLGFAPTGTTSIARGVSADGEVVVGDSRTADGRFAVRWTAQTGMVSLGDLPGGEAFSYASGISADGSTIVGTGNGVHGYEAFRWTQGTGLQGLGFLSGVSGGSHAYAASADGSVIVGASRSATHFNFEAFRWTESSGMVALGSLGGNTDSSAHAVSADGRVIVGVSEPNQSAFIWDDVNGMRSLQAVLVNEMGLDLTGWSLRDPLGITPDGKTIVGWGYNPMGAQEGWIATIPEPSTSGTIALLAVAGLAQHRGPRRTK